MIFLVLKVPQLVSEMADGSYGISSAGVTGVVRRALRTPISAATALSPAGMVLAGGQFNVSPDGSPMVVQKANHGHDSKAMELIVLSKGARLRHMIRNLVPDNSYLILKNNVEKAARDAAWQESF